MAKLLINRTKDEFLLVEDPEFKSMSDLAWAAFVNLYHERNWMPISDIIELIEYDDHVVENQQTGA